MEHERESFSDIPCSCATDKALEYYVKYGQERNIEKFLRLQPERIHSHKHCRYKMHRDEQPHCSKKMSHCSTALTSQILPLEIFDDETEENGENQTKEQVEANKETVKKSVVEIEVQKSIDKSPKKPTKSTKTVTTKNKNVDFESLKTVSGSSSTDTNASATLVRIFRESVESEIRRKQKRESKARSKSVETLSDDDYHTPSIHKTERRHTHTPESMARSHRRLEWDSLADIGYRRSMSHSNISVLERMVLKQLLQDCSINNLTERDYKLLEVLLQEKDTIQMTRTKSLDTPPLASSTHVELKPQQTPEPKEKSVQTTLSRANQATQAVQVHITTEESSAEKPTDKEAAINRLANASNTDSELSAAQKEEQSAYVCDTLLESTSTEGFLVSMKSQQKESNNVHKAKSYHRSKSLETPALQASLPEKAVQSSDERSFKRFERAIMSGISSLNNSSEDEQKIVFEQLEKTLHEQLLKRKKSVDKDAITKQLELGVQLLCALIDARQLQKSEKLALVTDIVKRICRKCGNNAASELLTMINPRLKAGVTTSTSTTSSCSTYEEVTKQEKIKQKDNSSPPTTSAMAKQLLEKNVTKRTITTQTSLETRSMTVPEESATTAESMQSKKQQFNDWLQPNTLSELEYEQQQREFEWNSKKRKSILEQSIGDISGKQEMLSNWLAMEIRRLERLRALMMNNTDYEKRSQYTLSSQSSNSVSRASEHSSIKPHSKEPRYPLYDQVTETPRTQVPTVNDVDIVKGKENKTAAPEARQSKAGTVKYTQPMLVSEQNILRERNKQTFYKKTTTGEITVQVQQRSKMATPSSSITSSESLTLFEAKQETATQTAPTTACTCRQAHDGMPQNNYYYPYHQCVHARTQAFNWHCCLCHTAGPAHYYATTATQAPVAKTVATSTKAKDKKNATTQKPSISSMSSTKSSSSSSSRRNTHTYTIKALETQSLSTTTTTTPANNISSEVSVPMGSTLSSNSTSTTTHQYDDLNSIQSPAACQDMAVQTSSTLLHAPLRSKSKSIAYVLEFRQIKKDNNNETESPEQIQSLQAHLEKKRPVFLAQSRQRKAMLNKLQLLRQERGQQLRELIENTSLNSIEPKLKNIPPLATG